MIRFVLKAGTHADHAKRACEDCAFLAGAVSLWCTNGDAVRARRTNIPGTFGCQFWQPMPQEAAPPERGGIRGFVTRILRWAWSPQAPIVVEGLPEPPAVSHVEGDVVLEVRRARP